MVTALVLQMVQCIVINPRKEDTKTRFHMENGNEDGNGATKEVRCMHTSLHCSVFKEVADHMYPSLSPGANRHGVDDEFHHCVKCCQNFPVNIHEKV